MIEKTDTLHIILTMRHVDGLRRRAADCKLSAPDYAQRLLQTHVDGKIQMPNPAARQMAMLSAGLIEARNELSLTRRALEQQHELDDELDHRLANSLAMIDRRIRDCADSQHPPYDIPKC